MSSQQTNDVVNVSDLTIEARSTHRVTTILDQVSLVIRQGERVGLIGQSGSGKTTLARTIPGLESRELRIVSGRIVFKGRVILAENEDRRHEVRGHDVGTIFQSASSSINPFRTVGSQLREVLRCTIPGMAKDESSIRVHSLLGELGLADPERISRSFPHQVSGGQLQRVAIALALLSDPVLLVADECTSALDVGTQAEVTRLLDQSVRQERALLFVTHDLRLAATICDRLVVMQHGRIVDDAATADILHGNTTSYTRSLMAALPPWQPADGTWPAPVAT